MDDDDPEDDVDEPYDIDDVDLDLLIGMTRLALDRIARDPLAEPPADRAEIQEHGPPAIAMMDGLEPLDLAALRHHVSFLGDSPKIARAVLGPDDASALEAVQRARAIRIGRAWGQDPHDE